MTGMVNGYYLETGYGFDVSNSNVYRVLKMDEFGALLDMELVFRGTWNECVEYANTH